MTDPFTQRKPMWVKIICPIDAAETYIDARTDDALETAWRQHTETSGHEKLLHVVAYHECQQNVVINNQEIPTHRYTGLWMKRVNVNG